MNHLTIIYNANIKYGIEAIITNHFKDHCIPSLKLARSVTMDNFSFTSLNKLIRRSSSLKTVIQLVLEIFKTVQVTERLISWTASCYIMGKIYRLHLERNCVCDKTLKAKVNTNASCLRSRFLRWFVRRRCMI